MSCKTVQCIDLPVFIDFQVQLAPLAMWWIEFPGPGKPMPLGTSPSSSFLYVQPAQLIIDVRRPHRGQINRGSGW